MGHKIGNTFGEDTSKIVDEEDFRKLNLQLKDILHERDKADKEFIAQQSEMVDLIGGDVLAKLMTNQVFAPGALNAIIAREMEVAVVCDNLVVRRKYPYKRKK